MARLQGKVALVTGVGSALGLGYAIARRFVEEGAAVVITDVNESGLQACQEQLLELGGEVSAWRQDVTDEGEWQTIIERTVSTHSKLDILVNNAGIAMLKPIEEITTADYDRQMQVNMNSIFLGTRQAVAEMRKNSGGAIVNMSSIMGLVGMAGVSVYAASKAAVRLFSKSIALECARDGIRCNTVHPGIIDTEMQQLALRDNPEQADIINNSIPMGQMGQPVDVANSVLFLASDEAAYVTGTEIIVDGGVTAQ